jgi:hypothetical protein
VGGYDLGFGERARGKWRGSFTHGVRKWLSTKTPTADMGGKLRV